MFVVCKIVLLYTSYIVLFDSCQKEDIPEQIKIVSVKEGKFKFLLSFTPFGDEISVRSMEKDRDTSKQSSQSESIVIPVDDDLNIYATLSTDPPEDKRPITTRSFVHHSKIRIVAYESSIVATDAIFLVDGNDLIRDGGDDARFELPPGDYVFVAFSLNSSTEDPPAIAPVLEEISPTYDLIWGISDPVHLEGPAIEVQIIMHHKMSQLKAVFATGYGGDPITAIADVTLPGFLVDMNPETGVLANAGTNTQVIDFPATPNDTIASSTTRTVFTGNPSADPTIFSIGTLSVGAKTLNDVKATFAKKLQSGYSYTLRMKIGESPEITDDLPPDGFIPYVGAFWKNDQTGERLIRIPRVTSGDADGTWTAQVIEGKDWIILDKVMSSDDNIGWRNIGSETLVENGNDSGFDLNHAVTGISTFVSGHLRENGSAGYQSGDEDIYFRIGLTGANPNPPTPRYGMVLLTYKSNQLRQRIWIRQGENADYLMRPQDLNGSSSRPEAQKFSPYNLTDPTSNIQTDYTTTALLGANGGAFVGYPSQAGYYFQWNTSTRAFNPYSLSISNWNTAYGNEYWNTFTDETCPTGYRRPQDGRDSIHNTAGTVFNSEIRQSLWLTPVSASNTNTDNSVWGYYADGFFDRRTISNAPGAYYGTNSSVSSGNSLVAHIGRLFFNPATSSSLFFPAAGNRVSDGTLQDAGDRASYWTGTSYDPYNAWMFMHNNILATMVSGYRYFGFPVRCIYDPRTISVSAQNLYFAWNANNSSMAQTVTVFNDFPDWMASITYHQGTGWLSVSPMSSSSSNTNITVVPNSDNNGTAPRTATITIKTGYGNRTILVTQNNKMSVTLTYNTPNTYSALIPASASTITGEAWGGGGGSGGVNRGMSACGGGGGGGGSYSTRDNFQGGATASITVGAGGIRGESQPLMSYGGTGGFSQIVCGANTITAYGGVGGQGVTGGGGNGGAGGFATGGITNSPGAYGGNGSGNNGGTGGYSPNGGGTTIANGNGSLTGQFGVAGAFPGGGAAGARCPAGIGGDFPGAKGADGRIIVRYDLSLNIAGSNIYTAGSTLLLSVAYPDAVTYTWKQNGTTVGTGPTLSISNITSANAGNYTVECSYSYSGASSLSVSGTGISNSGVTFTVISAIHNVTVIPQ